MARERPGPGRHPPASWPRVAARRAARRPADTALAAVAALAAALVFFVAHEFFPYHSINHDEGVYLQQAAMLLEGRLWLEPPVPDAVRPWFFLAEDGRLYPKYSPVTAAIFAPGLALGLPRAVLAVVAAAIAALVGLLGREAYDGRVGVVAAALVATSPLFVFTSATFLSYAPTTALNLLFALAYVRAHRRASTRYAALAGVAVGLAFFARPYTAVLFALPFVGHACCSLGSVWRRRSPGVDPWPVTRRLCVVAALGSVFVGVTLGYNWLVTGDPLLFPYEAFAPEDGPGFGHREIIGHERDYTPALALEANRRVLARLLGRWGPLGALGSGLAVVGLVRGFARPVRRGLTRLRGVANEQGEASAAAIALPDASCRALLAALFLTVPVGNVFFWGNLNVLADVSDPTDGLIVFLGPFYHFDLLLPLSVFGAAGVVAVAAAVRRSVDRSVSAGAPPGGPDSAGPTTVGRGALGNAVLALALVASLAGGGVVAADAFAEPADRNAERSAELAAVYEPIEDTEFENALVFVPTPYGEWLNHPFQWLRNDPSFDGDAVYVMDRGAAGDARSLAAFPDRTPYRFTYRGEWLPVDRPRPVLEPLTVREGDRLRVETTTGVVAGAEAASVRVAAGDETLHYGVEHLDGTTETVTWTLGPEGVRVDGADLQRYGDADSIPLDGPTDVTLSVTYVQPGGSSVTYIQKLAVVETGAGVRALWPPVERVCRLTTDCGREGTYLPGGDHVAGVSLSTNVTAATGRPGDRSER